MVVVLLFAILLGGVLVSDTPPTGAQATGDCKVVDDFSKAKVGELPPDWRVRKDEGKEAYRVQEEGVRLVEQDDMLGRARLPLFRTRRAPTLGVSLGDARPCVRVGSE